MSRENVDIVRAIYAQWEQGNFEAGTAFFDPEITFESFLPDANENVVVHGLDQLQVFTREWFAQWRHYRIIGEEFVGVGSDKVFVSGRQAATGLQSGVEVESPAFSTWTLRGGKVVKFSAHYDRTKALEAVGLRE